MDASEADKADDVNVSDLTSSGIEFKDATLDVSKLTGDGGVLADKNQISLSAGTLAGDELNDVMSTLTEAQKEQIGNSPIYNFTMSDADGMITNFGENTVTVTIPYTLAEGEDVNSIAIWYMSENKPVAIKATYNNGFVTFETSHFSYYTVTSLTPEERCALYKHVESSAVIAPTCDSEGYTLVVCIRCGESRKENIVPAKGHSYTSVTTDPNCTTAGKTVYTCGTCNHSYEEIIPATGHNYSEIGRTPASCFEYGTVIWKCSCGSQYTELLPKLPHSVESTTVAPTCDKNGYTLHKCVNDGCTYSYTDTPVNAIGHSLSDSWSWAEDYKTATLTLECGNDGCDFTFSKIVASVAKDTVTTCLKNRETTYTVKYVYNGETYSDSKTVTGELIEHDFDDITWKHNKHGHWHKCKYCSGQSELFDHEWDYENGVVTKAATCQKTGVMTVACYCGETTTVEIPVSTEHRYANGFCEDCGVKEPCKHKFDGGKITVEPTCQSEGERTYTCIVCGEYTETKTIPVSDRHTWDEGTVTLEPSCLGEGEMTYNCIHCDASYTETIDSHKGHVWGEANVIYPASCNYTGYMEYTCERCGEKRGETIPSLGGHKWDDGKTEIEPECLKDGLTVFTCSQCGETKSKIIPSLGGHTFDEGKVEIEPGCVTEGLYVYICEVCGTRKTERLESLGGHEWDDGVTKYEPTCTNDGLFVYTCSQCGETKSEIIKSLGGHKFDDGKITKEPTCTESGIKTYTCTVCKETETETVPSLGGHKYDGGKVTLEPTCTKNGNKEYTCTECGNKKNEAIAATGEHKYENGICTMCGHVNGECEHKPTVDVIFNLTDFGACEGIVKGKTCECGMLKIIDAESLNEIACDMQPVDQSVEESEDGTMKAHAVVKCSVCGLTADIYMTQTSEGCMISISNVVSFTIGDTVILENWEYYVTEEIHGRAHTEIIDLSEYTSCGGSIEAHVCVDCGKIVSVYDMELNCDGDYSQSEMTDDAGITHMIMTMTCDKCGIVITSDSYVNYYSDCEFETVSTVTFKKDGATIFEFTSEYWSSSHEYETVITMNGETCEDGYTVTEKCTKCSQSHKYTDYGHRIDGEELELPICGGTIYVEHCTICNEIISIPSDFQCNIGDYNNFEQTDGNGVVHNITTWTCSECGMQYVSDNAEILISECVREYNHTVTCTQNGEVILTMNNVGEDEMHKFTYEYKLLGETCEDGVERNGTCKVCGENRTETFFGHVQESNYYSIDELGGCGGWISISSCPCGEQGNINSNLFERGLRDENTYTDGEGALHTVTTYTCPCEANCTVIVCDKVFIRSYECSEIYHVTYAVTVNGEEFVSDLNAEEKIQHHSFEITTNLRGESCEDGVEITYMCTVCHQGFGGITYQHEIVNNETVYFTEYGSCEHHYFEIGSCACGREVELYSDLLAEGNARGECEKCGLVIETDIDIAANGCNYTEFVKVTASIGDNEITLYDKSNSYTQHSYTANATPNEDGSFTVTVTCTNCGDTIYKESPEYEDCPHSDNDRVPFATLFPDAKTCEEGIYHGEICGICGAFKHVDQVFWHTEATRNILYTYTSPSGCGGYIYEFTCPCGENSGIGYNFKCLFDDQYIEGRDEFGNWYDGNIQTCRECGVQLKHQYCSEKEGCSIVRYRSYTVTVNGSTVFEYKEEQYRNEQHDYFFECTLLGATCDNGYVVKERCRDCGLYTGYENTEYGHNIWINNDVDFFSMGACDNHYYNMGKCPCGQNQYTSTNIYDDLEYDREMGGYYCSDCGMLFKEVSDESKDGCNLTTSFHVEITINGEKHILMEKTETKVHHSFSFEMSKDESGALTVVRTCTDCGATFTTETDVATLTNHDGEYYFDFTFTPEEDGIYVFQTFPDDDRWINVTFYKVIDGELYSEYDTSVGHYPFFETLEAGSTYVFRIKVEWSDCEITVPYTFGKMDAECRHENKDRISQFATEEKDCERGVYTVEICKACGSIEYFSYLTYHHTHHVETIDLSKLGACNGAKLLYFACPCGKDQRIDTSYNCNLEYTEDHIEDERGNVHSIYTSRCPECGFTSVQEDYYEYLECYDTRVYKQTVKIGDVTVKESISVSHSNAYHEYEESYELLGADCDDGYTIVYTCKKCGDSYTDENIYYGHEMHGKHVWLNELGACEGAYYYTASCACGQNTRVDRNFNCKYTYESYEYTDEATGIEHSVSIYTCQNCGLTVTDDVYSKREGCYECYYTTLSISIGDTVVLAPTTGVDRHGNYHKFDVTFTVVDGNCENGYTATGVCSICGETYTSEGSDHNNYDLSRHELAELGLCEGRITIQGCACGENRYVYCDYSSCSFTYDSEYREDENGLMHEISTEVCQNCGLMHVTDRYEVKVGCQTFVYYTVTITYNGQAIVDHVTYVDHQRDSHNYVTEYQLKGSSCEDGVIETRVCSDCGHESVGEFTGHSHVIHEEYDLSNYGACGGTLNISRCLCGHQASVDDYSDCWISSVYDDYEYTENGIHHHVETYTCEECGLTLVFDYNKHLEGCTVFVYCDFMATIGDVMIAELSYFCHTENVHNYSYSYEMFGESCEDGYILYITCTKCGETDEYKTSGHDKRPTETIDLSLKGACGGTLDLYSCACGRYKSVENHASCIFETHHDPFTDENGVYHYIRTSTCNTCSFTFITDETNERDASTCIRTYYYTYSASINGEDLFVPFTSISSAHEEHDNEISYHLYGDSCEDGYTITYSCKDCDYRWTDERNYHDPFTSVSLDLKELGFCGGGVMVNECACGYHCDFDWNLLDCECESNSYESEENGITYSIKEYLCKNCGIKLIEKYYTVTEGCYDITYITYSLLDANGEVIVERSSNWKSSVHHTYDATYTVHGESCEDGVTIIRTCSVCGHSEEDYVTHHDLLKTETVELSDCGSYLEIRTCACGERSDYSIEMECFLYNTTHSYPTDENGIEHAVVKRECKTCGLVVIEDSYSEKIGCEKYDYTILTATVNGNEVLRPTEILTSVYDSHDYVISNTNLFGDSCEDGVEITEICSDCGTVDTYTRYWHESNTTDQFDLTEYGACDYHSRVYFTACPCGYYNEFRYGEMHGSHTDNSYYDDEGRLVHSDTYSCNECGLRISISYYTVKDRENCKLTYYYTYIVNVGAAPVCKKDTVKTQTHHDMTYTGVLDERAVDCTGGVTVTGVCSDCDLVDTNHYTYHVMLVTETYIPNSVCKGEISISECVCGQSNTMSSIFDLLCDFDFKPCEPWIDGALPEGSYETIDYWVDLHSSYGVFTCAVTDPEQCAYKIRYANYYTYVDGCVVQHCETFWFGYDEETGSYDKAVTIRLDSKYVIHNFTDTTVSEKYDDGSYMYDTRSICNKCGTTEHTYDLFNAEENLVKHEYEFSCPTVNPAIHENYVKIVEEYEGISRDYIGRPLYTFRSEERHYYSGETYSYVANYEYDFSYNAGFGTFSYVQKQTVTENGNQSYHEFAETLYEGYWFVNRQFDKYMVGTEEEHWYRYDNTYNFDGTCERTVHYTSSSGSDETYTEEAHPSIWHYETVKDPTCTQHGIQVRTCPLCKTVYEEFPVDPTAHNWSYIGNDINGNNVYQCTYCGLENINSASGEIVMEDLTEEYGNGENYVVGYWNRGEVQFLRNVSLMLHTPLDNGNDQIVLSEIEFIELEDVRAISFSKEAVEQAALALGYSADEYDVRFSFVPMGSDSSFDYAITFSDSIVQ